MKSYNKIAALIMILALLLCACTKEEKSAVDRRNNQSEYKDETENAENKANPPAVIYLCGERHSDETSIKRELEMWDELYTQ